MHMQLSSLYCSLSRTSFHARIITQATSQRKPSGPLSGSANKESIKTPINLAIWMEKCYFIARRIRSSAINWERDQCGMRVVRVRFSSLHCSSILTAFPHFSIRSILPFRETNCSSSSSTFPSSWTFFSNSLRTRSSRFFSKRWKISRKYK